jgi:hypothetical protein
MSAAKPPNSFVNSPKLRTAVGEDTGPRAVRPRKAVTEVDTPVMWCLPFGTSWTYTPGADKAGRTKGILNFPFGYWCKLTYEISRKTKHFEYTPYRVGLILATEFVVLCFSAIRRLSDTPFGRRQIERLGPELFLSQEKQYVKHGIYHCLPQQ